MSISETFNFVANRAITVAAGVYLTYYWIDNTLSEIQGHNLVKVIVAGRLAAARRPPQQAPWLGEAIQQLSLIVISVGLFVVLPAILLFDGLQLVYAFAVMLLSGTGTLLLLSLENVPHGMERSG